MNHSLSLVFNRLLPSGPCRLKHCIRETAAQISASGIRTNPSPVLLALVSAFYVARYHNLYRTLSMIATEIADTPKDVDELVKRGRKLLARVEKLCTTSSIRLTFRTRPAYWRPVAVDLVAFSCVRLKASPALLQGATAGCVFLHRSGEALRFSPSSLAAGVLYLVSLDLQLGASPDEIANVLCTSARQVSAVARQLKEESQIVQMCFGANRTYKYKG